MLRYETETRPGLVALYDIRPGNGAGLFLQPQSPHGAPVAKSRLMRRTAKQEAQLMLTTGSTRLAISRGQQTWYHFESIATFR